MMKGGTTGDTSEVCEAVRLECAQTGYPCNPGAPNIAVVAADTVVYPVIFPGIPVAVSAVNA